MVVVVTAACGVVGVLFAAVLRRVGGVVEGVDWWCGGEEGEGRTRRGCGGGVARANGRRMAVGVVAVVRRWRLSGGVAGGGGVGGAVGVVGGGEGAPAMVRARQGGAVFFWKLVLLTFFS